MGRTTGVVHWAGAVEERPDRPVVEQLEVLANQSGARIGMIRVVSESQLQATTDHLTGLLNRRAFESKVRDLHDADTVYSLVMADLDHFKQLNDTHGHDAGDRALRVFVSVLKSVLRPGDLACRYGGEEFVLALPNCDGADAIRVCERIREALALAGLDGSVPVFTCSFGVAPPRLGASLQDLVAEADAALYEAKHAGRDRSVVLDPVRRAEAEARFALTTRPDGDRTLRSP
jgi:diguanylate cyclase (GGDEF)-like protein